MTPEQIESAKSKYSEQEIKDMQELAQRRWVTFEQILEEFERASDQ